MGVHDVQWHLDRIESETVVERRFKHLQMDLRALVSGEAGIANLSRFSSFHHRLERPVWSKYAIGIRRADDFVKL